MFGFMQAKKAAEAQQLFDQQKLLYELRHRAMKLLADIERRGWQLRRGVDREELITEVARYLRQFGKDRYAGNLAEAAIQLLIERSYRKAPSPVRFLRRDLTPWAFC